MHSSFTVLHPSLRSLPAPPPSSSPPTHITWRFHGAPFTSHFSHHSLLVDPPAETAPHGSPRGWRQHGPLQLHTHGLDPHGARHQDRQNIRRFGVFSTSIDAAAACSEAGICDLITAVFQATANITSFPVRLCIHVCVSSFILCLHTRACTSSLDVPRWDRQAPDGRRAKEGDDSHLAQSLPEASGFAGDAT